LYAIALVDLFLQSAQQEDLALFPLEGVRQLLQKAIELGLSEEDYSALYSAF
jgi:3-hydroxyisobutyrate dehydrogenase